MKYLPPSRRGIRLAAALALTAAASLMFAACGGGGNTGTPGAEGSASGWRWRRENRRHVDHQDNTNPFFISMQKGAEDAAQGNNVSFTNAAGQRGRRRGQPNSGDRGCCGPRRRRAF